MDGHRREEAVINKELKFQSGGVVQLVRTPACHAGGRGFESRRSRQNFSRIDGARSRSQIFSGRGNDQLSMFDPAHTQHLIS